MTKSACLAESQALDWLAVASSNLGQVAFSATSDGTPGRMYVEFKAKGRWPARLYVYHDVPESVYRSLLAAPSKGKYLDRYVIKAGYKDDQLY